MATVEVNVTNPNVKQAIFVVVYSAYYFRPENYYTITLSGDISNYELLSNNHYESEARGFGLKFYKCDITPNGTTNIKIRTEQASDYIRVGVNVLY